MPIKDLAGVRDIHRLIRHRCDGHEEGIHVVSLAVTAAADPSRLRVAVEDLDDGGLESLTACAGGEEILDDAGRARFEGHLKRAEDDLEVESDPAKRAEIKERIERLESELANATGLGGRSRSIRDHVERCRSAVTKRIRTAIAAIRTSPPELGQHLGEWIQTGIRCKYDPRDLPGWVFS